MNNGLQKAKNIDDWLTMIMLWVGKWELIDGDWK